LDLSGGGDRAMRPLNTPLYTGGFCGQQRKQMSGFLTKLE